MNVTRKGKRAVARAAAFCIKMLKEKFGKGPAPASVLPPEFSRGDLRDPAEGRDEMAGVGESGAVRHGLDLGPGFRDQQFFCLADAEGDQIFHGGAVHVFPEKPGQILGRDEDQAA